LAYIKKIHEACIDVGIGSRTIQLSTDIAQEELNRQIRQLNDDKAVNAILLQLPLPKSLDEVDAISSIAPLKDVDGLHPCNLGLIAERRWGLVPCTPKAVLTMLKYYDVKIGGSHAVIINRSKIVGRPLSQLLLNEDATVTVCHSKTQNLNGICRQADILVSAVGHRSEFTVRADMIKREATVIDVGTSTVAGQIVGDVDFESVINVGDYVTPVPGGVGPVTISMLLYNTLLATCMQNGAEVGFNPYELKATERS
jgi:methylenetetrahydrofolate dehydrogenase (NADP+)/methenyltetrahydrofolate cyclohydrolase